MAAQSQALQPKEMDWTEDATLSLRYEEWKEECKLLLTGPMDKFTKAAKVSMVKLWMGKVGREYLKSIDELDPDDFTDLLNSLESWVKPKANAIAAFTELRKLSQGEQPLQVYINEVSRLTEACGLTGESKKKLETLAIVSGIASDQAYKKCISEGGTLTLHRAKEICRLEDAARRQCETLRPKSDQTSSQVHVVRSKHRNKPGGPSYQNSNRSLNNSNQNKQQQSKCGRCGSSSWHSKQECPARDAECHKCHKIGHYATTCRSRSAIKKINTEIDSSESDQESAPVHQINSLQTKGARSPEHIRPAWIAPSTSAPAQLIDCEVDTGAGCNILPLYQAKQLFNQLE